MKKNVSKEDNSKKCNAVSILAGVAAVIFLVAGSLIWGVNKLTYTPISSQLDEPSSDIEQIDRNALVRYESVEQEILNNRIIFCYGFGAILLVLALRKK